MNYYENDFTSQASNASYWKGYYYYKNGNVLSSEKISDYEYKGIVKSDTHGQYEVTINLKKPRTSKCNCPFALGNYKICKHKVALYLSVFKEKAVQMEKEIEEYEREQERKIEEEEKRRKKLYKEVSKWPKKQLVNYVVNTMMNEEEENESDYYRYYL